MVIYCRLFNIFEAFSWWTPCVQWLWYKIGEIFSIISNLAITTRIMVNYSKLNFFLKWTWNWNSMFSLLLDLKITFSLQCGHPLSIVCLSLILKSSENLPKDGKTKVNSLLGKKNFFIHWFAKFLGISIIFEYFRS